MKKQVIIFLFLLSQITLSKAQCNIGLSYIFSDITSNNVAVITSFDVKKKHQFSIGLKYHYNDDTTKPLFRHYYRNLYSEKLWQNFLGLTFEYRFFLSKNKIFRPYLLYNFQYSRIGSKFKEIQTFGGSSQIFEQPATLDPINFYENHIGVGLNVNVNNNLSFFIGISGGATFFTDRRDIDDANNGTATRFFISSRSEEFSWLFNTGFTVKIGKETPKKKIKC